MMLHLREKVTSYFGPIFQNLLGELHEFLWSHILLKIQQRGDPTIHRTHLLDLHEDANAHYVAVLGLIYQAILDLESEPLNAQYTTPTPVTPTRTTQPPDSRVTPILSPSGSSFKRQAEEPDMIDESPKSKKQKQRAYEKENERKFESRGAASLKGIRPSR